MCDVAAFATDTIVDQHQQIFPFLDKNRDMNLCVGWPDLHAFRKDVKRMPADRQLKNTWSGLLLHVRKGDLRKFAAANGHAELTRALSKQDCLFMSFIMCAGSLLVPAAQKFICSVHC